MLLEPGHQPVPVFDALLDLAGGSRLLTNQGREGGCPAGVQLRGLPIHPLLNFGGAKRLVRQQIGPPGMPSKEATDGVAFPERALLGHQNRDHSIWVQGEEFRRLKTALAPPFLFVGEGDATLCRCPENFPDIDRRAAAEDAEHRVERSIRLCRLRGPKQLAGRQLSPTAVMPGFVPGISAAYPFVRAVHGALVRFTTGGAGEVGLLGVGKGEAAVPLAEVERVGHRDVGGGEGLAGEIRRVRQPRLDQPQPLLERLQAPLGALVLALGLRRDEAADDDGHHQGGQARLAQVQELLVGGEGRIGRRRRQRLRGP